MWQRTLTLKPQIDGEIKKIDDTFKEYSSLLNQTFDLWKKNEALYNEASDAFEGIKQMDELDEFVFSKNVGLAEDFILKFRENDISKKINSLFTKKELLQKSLVNSRAYLEDLKGEFILAKEDAMVKLEAEKISCKFNQR